MLWTLGPVISKFLPFIIPFVEANSSRAVRANPQLLFFSVRLCDNQRGVSLHEPLRLRAANEYFLYLRWSDLAGT